MLLKIVVIILLSSTISAQFVAVPEDGKLNFEGLAIKYAEAVQEHYITTADGYILKLFRIPGDKTKPVLFVHGLMGSSNDFIVRGNVSIAVTLSRAGYDVWFINYRGNVHSRRHVTLNPDRDRSFWEFGPHQHGCYDLAASIDFVLNKTGQKQTSLIAHSQGTMITYILGSERPEYNDKIKVFIALAPVCRTHNIKYKLPRLHDIQRTTIDVAKRYKLQEMFAYNGISGNTMRYFCGQSTIGIEVCRYLLLLYFGFDAEAFEPEFMPILFSHFPSGTSIMNVEHEFQIKSLQRFTKFDYGATKNLKMYGSRVSPDYNLKKVTMRTYLIAATNDNLSVLQDTDVQAQELPNVGEYVVIKEKMFNHIDYIWGAPFRTKEVYRKLLEILQKYN